MQWVRPSVRATSSWWRHLGLSPWKYPGWENKFTCASKIPGVGHVHFLGSMTQFALYVSYVFAPSLSLMHLRSPPPLPRTSSSPPFSVFGFIFPFLPLPSSLPPSLPSSLRKQNEQLKEVLKFQEQEHRVAVGKLQQEHDLRVTRMKEQYIDLAASLLKDIGQNTKIASVDQKDGTRWA